MKTKEAYGEYLKSPHWKALRERVISRDKRCCVQCRSTKRLQAHHKVYRAEWTMSLPEDLITLCRSCHEITHGLKPVKVEFNQPAYKKHYATRAELDLARSHRLLTRCEYVMIKQEMGWGKHRKAKKARVKKKPKNDALWKNSIRLFNTPRPHWIQKGNSSN